MKSDNSDILNLNSQQSKKKANRRHSSLNSRESDKLIKLENQQNEDFSEKNGIKSRFELEKYLHFLIIRFNNLDKVEFDFNLILKYHRCMRDISNGLDMAEELKLIEKDKPFIQKFYYIFLEFFEFICDLIDYYSFLEPKCFSFRFSADKELLMKYLEEEEINNERFSFSVFYVTTSFSDLKDYQFSTELKEKCRILQHKFLLVFNKFVEIYPLPKGKKSANDYFDCLINNSLNIEIQHPKYRHIVVENTVVNQESLHQYKNYGSRLCNCLRTKPKDQIKYEKILFMISPLISLDIHHKSDENAQVLKRMIFEFARAYVKIEELLLIELTGIEEMKMSDNEKSLNGNDLKTPISSRTSQKDD